MIPTFTLHLWYIYLPITCKPTENREAAVDTKSSCNDKSELQFADVVQLHIKILTYCFGMAVEIIHYGS